MCVLRSRIVETSDQEVRKQKIRTSISKPKKVAINISVKKQTKKNRKRSFFVKKWNPKKMVNFMLVLLGQKFQISKIKMVFLWMESKEYISEKTL